jgi:hypothetical protein
MEFLLREKSYSSRKHAILTISGAQSRLLVLRLKSPACSGVASEDFMDDDDEELKIGLRNTSKSRELKREREHEMIFGVELREGVAATKRMLLERYKMREDKPIREPLRGETAA